MFHRFRRAAGTVLAVLPLLISMPAVAEESELDAASEHVVAAEIALHDGDYLGAATEYLRAAEISQSSEIARQATALAYQYGFDEQALRAAKRWHELEPDNDQALALMARLQLRAGDIRNSKRNFAALIKRSGEAEDELLYKLMPDIAEEDSENALELIRQLAKPYKDSALAHYAVAALALQANDLELARKRALVAMEIDPEWLKAKLLYGRTMLLDGETEQAIDFTARIIGDDPDPDPDARMELALMYMMVGRNDDALSQVNQVLLEQASRTDALRLMAIINYREGNLDAAWDDFEDLLASRRYTNDALFYLGRIADHREEFDKAIRLYSNIKGGQNAVPAQRRASALLAFEKEEPDKALEQLDAFAREEPEFAVDMVLAKAQLLASLERYPEALEQYDRVVEYRPENEGVALGRAELMLRMDRLDDSIDAYRDAVKRWPDSAISLNALGYTLADRTEEYREAEKLIRKAIKYDPENPAIIDSLGWVLFKLGQFEEALEQLQIAYAAFPDHEVAAHIVEVLSVLERKDEALELLVKAEGDTPDSELLQDVRERFFPETP